MNPNGKFITNSAKSKGWTRNFAQPSSSPSSFDPNTSNSKKNGLNYIKKIKLSGKN